MLAIGFSATSMKNGPRRNNIGHNCIHVLSMDHGGFYFKSDRDVAGAAIDVYSYKTGDKVKSDVIKNKKTILDMHSLEPGDYIILITKGDFKRKYVFHKK